MAECSTPLRGRQNFSLNESSILSGGGQSQNDSLHEKMDLLMKKVERLEKQLEKKTPRTKVTASKQCAQFVRQTYRSMEGTNGWNLKTGFNAPENMIRTAMLLDECKILADKYEFSREELQDAAKTFYRSLHDRAIRIENGKLISHKLANKRTDRLRRKLKARKAALSQTGWSDRKKEKVAAVLFTDYMSSECSGDESEADTLLVKQLQWESKKLRKYKKKIRQITSAVSFCEISSAAETQKDFKFSVR